MFKIKDAWQIVEEVSTEGTWTDVRDGQVYPYKQIGNQIWMTQNLNYGGKQGDWVPHTTAQTVGHAWRYNDKQNDNDFPFERGALYTIGSLEWAVPEGWHIPSENEINALAAYLDSEYGNHVASAKINSNYWVDAGTGTNNSGLTIVPTGYYTGTSFDFCRRTPSIPGGNNAAFIWTSTDYSGAGRMYLQVLSTWGVYAFSISDTNKNALAIRLIKDSGVYVPQPAISTIVTSLDSTGSDNKIPTEKATRSAITSAISSKMSNPMTSAGDIIVGGTSGEATVLSMGSQGQVLTVGVSGLEWANGSSGGDLPITTKGDMVIGDEDGNAIRMPIGTSGQTLMVNSSGTIEYCDIFSRSSVTSGGTIGTYTTSATNNNFLNIRGNYGYNEYNQNVKDNSGVMLKLNNGEFRVNTDSVVLGAPYDPSHAGAFFRAGRKVQSFGSNYKMILLGESGGSAGMGSNYTSAYTSVGNVAFAIGTRSDGGIYMGSYNNSNRAISAVASYQPSDLTNYNSYGAQVYALFKTGSSEPEWSSQGYYDTLRAYVKIGAGSDCATMSVYTSARYTNGGARQMCAFRVIKGWTDLCDKMIVRGGNTAYFTGRVFGRKIIGSNCISYSDGCENQQPKGASNDGGVVYGFGLTSARDALTTYGKDPGRQYYTTDDNRVNVYNNTTSGWDKIAYLSDVGGGSGGMVTEIGDMFSRETYGVYSDAVSFLYRFNPKSNTLHGGYFIPTMDFVTSIPEDILFNAVIFEGEGSWDDTVTKVAETSSFDTTNYGTDKKFRFTFEDTQLDDDKNYWLLFSVQYLSGQGNGSCLTSFAVNSNDMSNLAVAYSTDIITEKEDFDMYSQEPSSYMPYVVLV